MAVERRPIRHPPLHPRCRCCLTPWRAEWGEARASTDDAVRADLARQAQAEAEQRKRTERDDRARAKQEEKARQVERAVAAKAKAAEPPARALAPAKPTPRPDLPTTLHPRVELGRDIERAPEDLLKAERFLAEHSGGRLSLAALSHAYAPPEGFKLVVSDFNVRRGEVQFHADIVGGIGLNEGSVGSVARYIKVLPDGKLAVHHGYLSVDKNLQGSGIAGAIVDRSFAEYRKWGVVDHVELDANWIGRYAWARRGFEPTDESRVEIRRGLEGYLARRQAPAEARRAVLKRFDESTLQQFAGFDDGQEHPNDNEDRAPGDPKTFKFGKAFMLSPEMPSWVGRRAP